MPKVTKICEKMVKRKAWDEIALLLVGQLGPEDTRTVLKLLRRPE